MAQKCKVTGVKQMFSIFGQELGTVEITVDANPRLEFRIPKAKAKFYPLGRAVKVTIQPV